MDIYLKQILYYITIKLKMSSYICTRCGFETTRKLNLKRHLFRKRICEPTNSDTSIKSIAEFYGIEYPPTEKIRTEFSNNLSNTSNLQKHTNYSAQTHTNYSTQAQIHTHTQCKYCNKQFNSTNSCYRHQKHYCKYKKKEITITQDEINKIKQEADKKAELKIKELKLKIKEAKKETERKIKEVEEKYEVIADKKAQHMVLSIVDKLIPTNQTTNNNNSHNNIQNNNITQNNNIQNNTNLKINNFGKEKTKYITDANLKIMFVDPRNVIVQHIKDTYYHVLHPENFNAKITNCKSKHMHILKDNKWEKVNKQLTICSMYNKHEKIIESEFERLKPELTETVRDNYKDYKQSTLHSFNTFKHRMVDIEAVIINGTKEHKQIDLLSEKEVARLAKEQGKTPGEIFAEHMPDIFAERDGLID